MNHSNTRRFTCRYWALGPRCPDGGRCCFAHRDTGQLATTVQQPGSCLTFSKYGYCYQGSKCGYEHRWTGVTGLHQGTIELVGFELQVANAAYRAGFNTTNHPGLFDLIWAVRRQMLRKSRPPLPPHPIYPDRYRPSGIGDNTNKKRKRDDGMPPKFNPVPPLMQTGNSKDNPIVLDSEDEKKPPKIPEAANKKVKINKGGGVIAAPKCNHIVDEILKVKNRLEAVSLEVNGCHADMKIFFDKNKERFDDDDIMFLFENLANAMNKTYDGALEGGVIAEKAAATVTFGRPVFQYDM